MLDNWIKSWDRPIGSLIEDFVDFDKETVAQIQTELLALYTQQVNNNVPDKDQADLFGLLGKGRDAVHAALEEWSISEDNLTAARAIVDSGEGMPRAVPPFGLIAKIGKFVSPAVCDELLTVQAAARILGFMDMKQDAIPSLEDATNDKRFGFIGKNDKEPATLVAAQCFAHLGLIYKAAEKVSGETLGREDRFAVVAKSILETSSDKFAALKIFEAQQSIIDILPEIKPADQTLEDARGNVHFAVGQALGAAARVDIQSGLTAKSMASARGSLLEKIHSGSNTAAEGKPPSPSLP